MEEYRNNRQRDILGNLSEDPHTIEDDIVQEEEEPISMPIKIIGWVIAILIIVLVTLVICFLFVYIFDSVIWGIIIVIGLIGCIPALIKGKF